MLSEKLLGRRVLDVSRKGKYLWLTFDNDTCLVIHFGMTGSLSVDGMKRLEYMDFKVDESWPPRYTKFEMVFDNTIRVAMTDARRLGRVELVDHSNPLNILPLSKLGNDPIEEPMSSERFSELIRKRGTTLKALLLNQQMVYCGIGNWLCDDICYEAKIHPATKCSNLSEKQITCLHDAIRHVCKVAVNANAESSKFPKNWLFHVRWRKSRKGKGNLALPNGHVVTFETVAGRTTAVVKSEQRRGEKLNTNGDGTESKYFKKKSSSSKSDDTKERKRRRKQ